MLIIVESPAKAKTISQIINKIPEYKGVIVKASVGHIRSLTKDKKASGNKVEIAGIDDQNGFAPIYEIDPTKKDVVKELKKLAKNNEIILATDSDREGEAISWHITEVLKLKNINQLKRLEFHEITPEAIKRALDNPGRLNMFLVKAQQARQALDKIVGFKISPIIWKVMGNRHLSAGRVQSPALRIICEREQEIMDFKPEEYWEIKGRFKANDPKFMDIYKSLL